MRAWVFARSSTIPKKNEGLIDGLVTVYVQYIFEVKRVWSSCWIPCHSVPPLFSLVGVLWRTKHNTIDAILIQWHANKWQGILQLSRKIIRLRLNLTYAKWLDCLIEWYIEKVNIFYNSVASQRRGLEDKNCIYFKSNRSLSLTSFCNWPTTNFITIIHFYLSSFFSCFHPLVQLLLVFFSS